MNARPFVVAVIVTALAACSSRPEPAPVVPGGLGNAGELGPGGGPSGIGASGPGAVGRSQLAPGLQREFAATAGDRVLFAYDRSDISPEGQQTLQRQAEWLRRYPNLSVTIEGHADERGTREYNLSLGERRAETVKNVLIALGVSSSRLSTISYGKERPEVPHSDQQSYAQNRRSVTVIN